jgi:hypothetical protein
LAYQPPASSTFLSEQTSHQQPDSNTFLSEQTSTSHQPPAKRTGSLTKEIVQSLYYYISGGIILCYCKLQPCFQKVRSL